MSSLNEQTMRLGYRLLRQGLGLFLNGEGVSKRALLFQCGGNGQTVVDLNDWVIQLKVFSANLPVSYGKALTTKFKEIGNPPHRLIEVASVLSCLQTTLDVMTVESIHSTHAEDVEVSFKGKVHLDGLDPWRKKMFSKLITESRFLSPYCLGYYLHGSAGEGNMTSTYSDVDTLMVIRNTTMASPERLLELRKITVDLLRYFYAIDPLQHHGHLVITESELHCYSQNYLPLDLWREAVPLLGPGEMTIRSIGHDVDQSGLQGMLQTSQLWVRDGLPGKNLYRLKSATSLVQLFPSLFLQATGRFMSKREAFTVVQKEFPNELWEPIHRVTRMRDNWPAIPFPLLLLRPLLVRLSSPWAIYYAARILYGGVPIRIKQILQEDFSVLFCQLVEAATMMVSARNSSHV